MVEPFYDIRVSSLFIVNDRNDNRHRSLIDATLHRRQIMSSCNTANDPFNELVNHEDRNIPTPRSPDRITESNTTKANRISVEKRRWWDESCPPPAGCFKELRGWSQAVVIVSNTHQIDSQNLEHQTMVWENPQDQ